MCCYKYLSVQPTVCSFFIVGWTGREQHHPSTSFVRCRHALWLLLFGGYCFLLTATLGAIHMRDTVPSSDRHGVQITTLSGVALSISLVRISAFPYHPSFWGSGVHSWIQFKFRSDPGHNGRLCYRLHLPRSYCKRHCPSKIGFATPVRHGTLSKILYPITTLFPFLPMSSKVVSCIRNGTNRCYVVRLSRCTSPWRTTPSWTRTAGRIIVMCTFPSCTLWGFWKNLFPLLFLLTNAKSRLKIPWNQTAQWRKRKRLKCWYVVIVLHIAFCWQCMHS